MTTGADWWSLHPVHEFIPESVVHTDPPADPSPVLAPRRGSSEPMWYFASAGGGCEPRRLFALISVNTESEITAVPCTHHCPLMAPLHFFKTHMHT